MEQQIIECSGVLDITAVAQWSERAQAALQTGTPICLKADELERIDTAGLQALLGLFMAADKQSIPVQWESPSTALQQAARLTGLNHYLRLV